MSIPSTNSVSDLDVRDYLNSLIDGTDSPSDLRISDQKIRGVLSAIRDYKDGNSTDIPSPDQIEDEEVRRISQALIDNL